jgi:hypothetical protein
MRRMTRRRAAISQDALWLQILITLEEKRRQHPGHKTIAQRWFCAKLECKSLYTAVP